jgi:hypothetical protein
MLELKTSDASMGCCGVAYMHNIPATSKMPTNNIFGAGAMKKDLDTIASNMKTAKTAGKAVMIVSTTPGQPYARELLEASGFTLASTSKRPSGKGGNTILIWTAPLAEV